MPYPPDAVERVMKVQAVILRALAGQLTWLQAADILGRSPRSIRRLRWKLDQYGMTACSIASARRPSAPMDPR